ncbi:MAG: DnaJ domain-containing protein [Methylococcales bacterium]|nr:DnaJ domain-containing protein [Methylococcales bacterium]
MIVQSGGVFLYLLMAFGSGYAVGNLRVMGFVYSWVASILFVPVVYELLNANFLMVLTVVGFSLGLFSAKVLTIFELLRYFSTSRFLQTFRKSKYQTDTRYHAPQFSNRNVDAFDIFSDGRKAEEILGLNADFTQAELKAAYQRETNRTHPDKWANKPDSIKAVMENEQKLINLAYRKLSQLT